MSFTNPFLDKRRDSDKNIDTDESLPDFSDAVDSGTVTAPVQAPIKKQLPTMPHYPAKAAIGGTAVFNALLEDDDDEDYSFSVSPTTQESRKYDMLEGDDLILKEIQEIRKKLNAKYPMGGIKTSRIITTDVLIKAPADYFDKYSEAVSDGIKWVRNNLTKDDKSAIIRDAEMHPTDDAYQEAAYSIVWGFSSEYLGSTHWQGIHRAIITTMISNEIIGFGRLDPLWRDRTIDEIICNGPYDIQIEVKGEIHKVPACKFDSQTHIMNLIDRLYRAVGKTLTQTTAQVKGRLHDKSRMQATHPSISPDGPNFAIRRHPRGYWTPEAMVERGAASEELMTFIGNQIYKGGSYMVIGGTHSGKTSMLNALTGFYKPKVRILTLEDNLEMKPNPKKFLAAPLECRDPSIERPNDTGTNMRDLVKVSMQLRPDVIIVGEVTDHAAYDLCQALNTGHAGASTIHANGSTEAVTRVSSLIAQGGLVTTEGAMDMISKAFDFIVSIKHFPIDGSRRIVSVDEVETNPVEVNGRLTLLTRPLWRFVDTGLDDNKKVTGYWEQVGDISEERRINKMLDIEADKTWEELRELSSLPADKEKA